MIIYISEIRTEIKTSLIFKPYRVRWNVRLCVGYGINERTIVSFPRIKYFGNIWDLKMFYKNLEKKHGAR